MISYVFTLANSIIGVSVLAMPFCFKQCGIVLAVVVLILCSLLSRLACYFLIKSAVMSRRRNYEFLAFHAFGPMGKFFGELFIIGFLLGTCIAFFVVIGDLGSQIIGKMLYKNPEDIRVSFLLTAATLIILPLGLLRNIDSLASICTVTIGFYLCLVLKVFGESMEHIFLGDWYNLVNYWRPAGILQCLPIFSMALFCQTQLFEIYESIPNVTLEKMNAVVKSAINICTLVYISMGVFGYIAFCMQPFSGNILMSFEPSMTSDAMKIGFVLSVVFSFPLVIFPCRASLNSLLFRRVYMHESASNYIPEIRFRCLTFIIVTVSLITGVLMPNIEFVLGFVGSTIGVMICLIFPAGFFIAISTKNTNERLVAQAILFVGMWIMILGSYANLYAIDDSLSTKIPVRVDEPLLQFNSLNNPPLSVQEALKVFSKEEEKLSPPLIKDPQKPPKKVEKYNLPINMVERPIITEAPQLPKVEVHLPDFQGHLKEKEKPGDPTNSNGDKPKETQEFHKEKEINLQENESPMKFDAVTAAGSVIQPEKNEKDDKNLPKMVDLLEIKKKDKSEIKIVDHNKIPMVESMLKVLKTQSEENKSEIPPSVLTDALNKTSIVSLNAITNESLAPALGFRGPILTALTNRTIPKVVSNFSTINNDHSLNLSDTVVKYQLPIALKYSNLTKKNHTQTKIINQSVVDTAAVHRDILENREREKRETNQPDLTVKMGQEESVKYENLKNLENQNGKCTKNQSNDDAVLVEKDIIPMSLETTTKTNAFLPSEDQAEYKIVKKRDLKAVKFDTNTR